MLGNGLPLLFIFGFLELLLPVTLGPSAVWISQRLSGTDDSLRLVFTRYAPALVPLGFAIWLAHYGRVWALRPRFFGRTTLLTEHSTGLVAIQLTSSTTC